MDCALHRGWSTKMLPRFNGDDTLYLTANQEVWIINITYFALGFGAFLPIILLKKYSLKGTLVISSIPKITSWLIIGLASEYWLLLLGRFLAGIGISISFYIVPLYIGETVNKNIRGRIGTVFTISTNVALTTSYVVAIYFNRLDYSLAVVALPIIFLLCSYWLPSSPVFLLKRNEEAEARRVLNSLGENVLERVNSIKKHLTEDSNKSNKLIESLKKPQAKKSFYLATILQLCDIGTAPILIYQCYVYESSNFDDNLWVVASGVLPTLATVLHLMIVRYTGKKKILLTTLVATFTCQAVIFAYYLLEACNVDTTHYQWVPSVFTLIYLTNSRSGVYSMVLMYLGEIYGYDVKPVAALYSTMLESFTNAFVVEFHQVGMKRKKRHKLIAQFKLLVGRFKDSVFQVSQSKIGYYAPYAIYTIVTFVNGILIYLHVPETEGKTLEEIQDELRNSKNKYWVERWK